MENKFNEGKHGGKREHYYPMFELLEPCFLERIAKVLTAGAEKYGLYNWQNFDEEQILDIKRHAFKHIVDFMHGNIEEDHLANAACNIMFLMWFEGQGKIVV